MTKEQKDKILKALVEDRNDYARDCRERIEKEYGKIIGADYMLQRFLDVLRTEVVLSESEDQGMNEQMTFPETFEGFAKEYGFKDDKEVYTNGSDLIPIFRVKQWLEQDNKLRTIEIDAAYECGKHANKWIPVSERLPENFQRVLVTIVNYNDDKVVRVAEYHDRERMFQIKENHEQWEVGEDGLLAWMPLPEPYKAESEDEE